MIFSNRKTQNSIMKIYAIALCILGLEIIIGSPVPSPPLSAIILSHPTHKIKPKTNVCSFSF